MKQKIAKQLDGGNNYNVSSEIYAKILIANFGKYSMLHVYKLHLNDLIEIDIHET